MKQLFETDTTIEERFGKCPFATVQSLISGKWAILILHYLGQQVYLTNQYGQPFPVKVMRKMIHDHL